MKMLRYSSPLVQVIIVGFICLLTSGMFNALNGIGGAGQLDTRVASNANVALYTCFAVGGLFAGAVVNKIGPSISLVLGGLTYAVYTGSLLYYNHKQREDFPIVAGAILGFGAALLWTGQGAIMLSYPTEDNKGKYIELFWVIFNFGGVLGSLIPITLNWNGTDTGTVNDGTYIAFMVLMGLGGLLAFSLLPPHKVLHDDGKPVVVQKFPKWKDEITGIIKLFLNWRMLALFPMFMASNWFYAYQFNAVNAGYFNIRTRSFNNLWYWASQIVGAMTFGRFLDTPSLGRRKRGIMGLLILFITLMATWIGGLIFQLSFKRGDEKIDFDLYDSGYAGKVILYIVYGFNDAMYQCYAYWIMGALTNDASVLARYTGYYKAIQSAGAAISWRIDAVNTSYLIELIICWVWLIISIPFAFIVALSIKDTNYSRDSKDLSSPGTEKEKVEKSDVENKGEETH